MSYVQDNLAPNEKILLSARCHWAVFLRPVISLVMGFVTLIIAIQSGAEHGNTQQNAIAGLSSTLLCFLAVGFMLASIFLSIAAIIYISTTEFAITNRRVIAKRGFIRRRTLELFLSKVESVRVHQGIMGRILNFGTVTVTGTGGTRESFNAIQNPLTVKRKLNQILEHYT
jgi:uncharacterized membrane protein YdbT with pleckstrin-like domain